MGQDAGNCSCSTAIKKRLPIRVIYAGSEEDSRHLIGHLSELYTQRNYCQDLRETDCAADLRESFFTLFLISIPDSKYDINNVYDTFVQD